MPAARVTAAFLTSFFLSPALPTAIATALPLVGNISAGLGMKWSTDPVNNPVHEGGTPEPTVNVMLGYRALPIMLEGYVSGTRQDGRPDTDDDTGGFQETRIEIGLGAAGVRKIGPFHSHLGGGAAWITTKTKRLYALDPRESSFTRTGHWIGGGVFIPVVAGFNIGAIGRYASVKVSSRQNDDLGGWSGTALVGWGRPNLR